jgi:hypothetical protein
MILTKSINLKVNIYNIEYFPNNKIGDYLEIMPLDLPIGSGKIIEVECDYCGKKKSIQYRKYIKNTKNLDVSYSCSNRCSVVKSKQTCMDKYGVDNVFKLDEKKDKFRKTCEEKYGCDNPLKNTEVSKKMVATKEKSGIYSSNRSEYIIYRNKCRTLTRLNRLSLLGYWDGFDFYDGEYIIDYLKLHPLDALYPTVDHKISILEGFKNNIPPNIISDIRNLCVTKRKINSSYGGRKK